MWVGVQTLGGQKLTSFGQLHMGSLATKVLKLRSQLGKSGDGNDLIQFGCIIGNFFHPPFCLISISVLIRKNSIIGWITVLCHSHFREIVQEAV